MSENNTTEAAQKPFFTVLSGNPDDTQVAALTMVIAGLAKAAAQAQLTQPATRNNWGNVAERLNRPTTFNPSAFQNVNFF
ncbi:acyl-CoA carboxylase subunit epsilon [Corynebacterium callunae]|uniref:acyl-CoA carboxylase subunit epsilon n=1 Tax=Corynebacterium callunae TaxID=1721 RepID=UPI003981D69E